MKAFAIFTMLQVQEHIEIETFDSVFLKKEDAISKTAVLNHCMKQQNKYYIREIEIQENFNPEEALKTILQ